MKFERIRRLYCNNTSLLHQQHFAMLPTPLLKKDYIRIFYASTDFAMNGRVFSLDVDRQDPTRIMRINKEISLDIGHQGCFDQHGVNPICVLTEDNRTILYYAGYDRSQSVPYTLFSGVAVSDDGGLTFHRMQENAVLPPTDDERYFRTALHVHRDGLKWRGWYIGGDRWTNHKGKALPIYSLRYCESRDGLTWGSARTLLEPDLSKGEIGFGRPFLVKRSECAMGMFISVRTVTGYRQGYMESPDGHDWGPIRYDVLSPSRDSWDSEMTCYGAPLTVGNKEYLFYNGNGLGRTGFGVGVREV